MSFEVNSEKTELKSNQTPKGLNSSSAAIPPPPTLSSDQENTHTTPVESSPSTPLDPSPSAPENSFSDTEANKSYRASTILRQVLECDLPSEDEDDSDFEVVNSAKESDTETESYASSGPEGDWVVLNRSAPSNWDSPKSTQLAEHLTASGDSSSIHTRKRCRTPYQQTRRDMAMNEFNTISTDEARDFTVEEPPISDVHEGTTPSPDRKKLRGVIDDEDDDDDDDDDTGVHDRSQLPLHGETFAVSAPQTDDEQQPSTAFLSSVPPTHSNEAPPSPDVNEERPLDEDSSSSSSEKGDDDSTHQGETPVWLGATERSPEKTRLSLPRNLIVFSSTDYSNCRNLPPPRENEVEFVIEDFFALRCNNTSPTKLYSQTKTYNSVAFRILVFPKGNHGDRITALKDLSAYVAVDPSSSLPPQFESKWCLQRCEYQLLVINWRNWRERSILKSEQYTFMSDDPDRGWRDLVPSEGLRVGDFLGPDGQLVIRAQVVPKSVDASNHAYQGRQELGYIGIKNQGATCYLNSLVQALYHIGTFRKSVFELTLESDREFVSKAGVPLGPVKLGDTAESAQDAWKLENRDDQADPDDDNSSKLVRWNSEEIRQAFESESKSGGTEGDARGVSLALQSLFLKMTTSNEAVTTDDLIKSFGWQSNESLTQHDAQELNRLLCDRLEEQMKGTPAEGAIENLFMGEFENYVECLDVPYGSCRREKFYDLQLDVQDMKDMYESLENYTAEEILEGDNLYDAEHYGKQRAKKGVRFIRFPPVIQFHLKRFTFDPTRMDMVKINQRFEYPEQLDLSRVLPGAGTYDLFCVIVHAGDVGGGHYYVINRPGGKPWWMKFDDEKVYPVSAHSALTDSYGGHDGLCWDYVQHFDNPNYKAESPVPKLHSAYILFYIKSDLSQELLAEPDPDIVNPYLVQRLSREEEQKKKRLQIQRYVQRYVNVRYVSECSLRGYRGFLNDLHTIPAFHEQRYPNDMPLFNLWKAVDAAVQTRELNDPLLVEMHGTYFLGLWYFDGTLSNRMAGRAADVRPLPCHMSESTRRQYSIGDHLGWISKSLRLPWKPTLSLLIHPLFIRERPKVRSVTNLASTILEMRIFIAKIFNPGRHKPRLSEQQTLVVAGIPLLKFDKDRRQSPIPMLLTELARSLVDSPNYQFDDPEIQEFSVHLQSLFSPTTRMRPEETMGIHSCYFEEGGSFDVLPATGSALAERLEASRHSRVEDPCPIIVFSLPPSAEAVRLRGIAEAYGTGPGAETFYEDDCEVATDELRADDLGGYTGSGSVRADEDISSTIGLWEGSSHEQSANIKIPDGATAVGAFTTTAAVVPRVLDTTSSTTPCSPLPYCFDGNYIARLPRRQYPPRVPTFVSCTPIDWHRALTRSRISVLLKLYDPLSILGRWEDASGHPIAAAGIDGEMKCSLSASSLFDGATPTETAVDTTSGSGAPEVMPLGEALRPSGSTVTQLAVRCPPLKERRLEIDLRWPYALALKRLCWFLGEHEESCIVMTAPPLAGDALAFSYRSCPSLVFSEDTLGWPNAGTRPLPGDMSANRLNELHCLLAQRQGQPRYRDITRPPDETFVSDIQYHFALLPRNVSSPCLGLKGVPSSTSRAVLVRVFNSKVENVGCVLVEVDTQNPPTIQEFIEAAQARFSQEMIYRGAPQYVRCRLLWIGSLSTDPGTSTQCSPVPSRLEILTDQSFKLRLSLLTRGFQFDTPLRLEPEFPEAQLNDLTVSESLSPIKSLEDQILVPRALKVLVLHQNRERQYFGHPFFIVVSSCDTLKTMKEKIHAKLELAYASFCKWKFFVFDFEHTSFVRDDEVPDFSGGRLPCLLAVHRNIYAAEERSKTLQLHIK